MALFGSKKKTEDKVETPAMEATVASVSSGSNLAHVLRHARITEKATMHQGAGVYTFDVSNRATKRDVIAAVRALYKVVPIKIAVVRIPTKARRNSRTGKSAITGGGKKAYVYLKKGDVINL